MASSVDSFLRSFEGTRSAYPVAIFRVAFFGGLALHFFPTLLWLDEAYRPGALRSNEWNDWLFSHFWRIPHGWIQAGAILTMLACVMAIVGLLPRVAAGLSGAGFYAFASFNGLHLQTLALVEAWAILTLWTICGGGANVLSIHASLRRPRPPRTEPSLLANLVLFQVLLSVFFAGVEKVLAGWPWSNEMGILLAYPRGFLVRDWVAASPWLHSAPVTHAFTWLTLLVELGAPPALLFRRTRLVAFVVFELFFLGIIAMLEVPPLFYFEFAFGALLALSDEDLERARAWWVRHRTSATRVAASCVALLGGGACNSSSGGSAPPASPCDDYFDAIEGVACSATTPPAAEVARVRTLFEHICANRLALPGSGVTATSLEACASAVKSLGCGPGYLTIPECSFRGSLPVGAPCNDGAQCASGSCPIPIASGADGGTTAPPCGTCAMTVPLGQACRSGDTCAYGSTCAAADGGFACTAISFGDPGAMCDGIAAQCKTGASCNLAMQTCVSPGGEGAPCVVSQDCAGSFSCSGSGDAGPTCRPPAAAGEPCAVDGDCASGLGCSLPSFTCAPIAWASPGEACGNIVRCMVGICPLGSATMDGSPVTGGTCPSVVTDGQPCVRGDQTHTCDTFSSCTNGECRQPYAFTCR